MEQQFISQYIYDDKYELLVIRTICIKTLNDKIKDKNIYFTNK